jgi:hypothetical protein
VQARTGSSLPPDLQLGPHFRIFGEIAHLFAQRYYSCGSFTGLHRLLGGVTLSNPCDYSPDKGRAYTGRLIALLTPGQIKMTGPPFSGGPAKVASHQNEVERRP